MARPPSLAKRYKTEPSFGIGVPPTPNWWGRTAENDQIGERSTLQWSRLSSFA